MWHTLSMSTKLLSSTKSTKKADSTVGFRSPKALVFRGKKRVLKNAGHGEFVLPSLSGDEAVAMMKAAGIWTKSGKLSKSYR